MPRHILAYHVLSFVFHFADTNMKTQEFYLFPLQNQNFNFDEKTSKPQISQVFWERNMDYNESTLYTSYFNTIPNCIQQSFINCNKANLWFLENYRKDTKDYSFNEK